MRRGSAPSRMSVGTTWCTTTSSAARARNGRLTSTVRRVPEMRHPIERCARRGGRTLCRRVCRRAGLPLGIVLRSRSITARRRSRKAARLGWPSYAAIWRFASIQSSERGACIRQSNSARLPALPATSLTPAVGDAAIAPASLPER